MQRKRDELVPIAEAFSDLSGPVAALRDASPQALHHFTQADQVNQLISAREADPERGFMARMMALCSLPRTNPGNRIRYVRRNGPYTLYMTAGGGNAHTKLRNQMRRLFGCTVQLTYKAENGEATVNAVIADRTEFWWNKPDERTLWDSKIELSEKFFNEIINRPVPLDMNILTALKRCSLGLEVPAAQAGEGADTGPGVGEGAEEGAVAEADDMGDVEGSVAGHGPGGWRARGSCRPARRASCPARRRTGSGPRHGA